jgi:hypothetical protein
MHSDNFAINCTHISFIEREREREGGADQQKRSSFRANADSGLKCLDSSPGTLKLRTAPHSLRTLGPSGERLVPKDTEDKDNGRKRR